MYPYIFIARALNLIRHGLQCMSNEEYDLRHISFGIQTLPAIYSQASKIMTFIRKPTWVGPIQGPEQPYYSEEERQEFETDPDALLKYRKLRESTLNSVFPLFVSDSDL